jgi:hypothetical protein
MVLVKRMTAVLLAVGVTVGSMVVATPAQAIIGGHQVPENLPFLAYLETGSTRCSAVLIKFDWVATAKHCKTSRSSTRLRIGNIDRTKGTVRGIADDGIGHPVADLKLLKLDSPVNHVPVPIATSPSFVPSGLYAMGWGQTCHVRDQCSSPPKIAKEFFVQVTAESAFPTRCRENGAGEFDTDNQMCLFTSTDGQTGTCYGDSGGPVLKWVTDTSWLLVGLVDEGVFPGCVNTHIKATDLYFQRDWIRSVVGPLPT